ncbi:MAG: glutamate ligase domain-containing protein, partial [Gammaproteobacteria bacterium]
GNPFITFGLNQQADVYATDIKTHHDGTVEFVLHTLSGFAPVHLSLIGEHNVMNALAAAAVGVAAGVPVASICKGLVTAKAVDKRLVPRAGLNGVHIIDDTYNANPIAMEMAIKVLMQYEGEKVFVTGDMVELGPETEMYHYRLGEKARRLGVNRIYTVGELSRHTADGFGADAYYFTDQDSLIHALQAELKPSVHILIKGSRSTHMENVVKALLPKERASV